MSRPREQHGPHLDCPVAIGPAGSARRMCAVALLPLARDRGDGEGRIGWIGTPDLLPSRRGGSGRRLGRGVRAVRQTDTTRGLRTGWIRSSYAHGCITPARPGPGGHRDPGRLAPPVCQPRIKWICPEAMSRGNRHCALQAPAKREPVGSPRLLAALALTRASKEVVLRGGEVPGFEPHEVDPGRYRTAGLISAIPHRRVTTALQLSLTSSGLVRPAAGHAGGRAPVIEGRSARKLALTKAGSAGLRSAVHLFWTRAMSRWTRTCRAAGPGGLRWVNVAAPHAAPN